MNWNWCRVSRWDREIFQIFIKALHRSLYTRARWQFPYWLHVPPHMYFYVEFNFKANMFFFILTIIQFGKLIFPILMGKLLKISPKWEEILKSAHYSPKSGKRMEHKSSQPFLGGCWHEKVVSFFGFGRSKSLFSTQKWALLCRKCQFLSLLNVFWHHHRALLYSTLCSKMHQSQNFKVAVSQSWLLIPN